MKWSIPHMMVARRPIGNGYAGGKLVVLNHLKVPNTNQTDFTAPLSGTFTYLKTVGNGGLVQNSSGYDIIFTSDSAGLVLLKWKLIKYDPVTGEILVYIKFPTVSTSIDSTYYMWYGNASISTFQGDSVNAWDSTYAGVYPFGDGTTLDLNDAKGSVNLSNNGVTATTGIIGGAANFNGTSAFLNAGNNFGFTGDFSVVLWSYATNVVSIFAKVPNGTGKANPVKFGYYGGTNKMGLYLGDGTNETISSSNTLQSVSTWTHLGIKLVGTTYTFYINGVPDGTGTNAQSRVNNAGVNFTIGTNSGVGTEFYAGKMCNFWLSSGGRSDDWFAATYNSQFSPSTFISLV